jgi:hypothetical protein
MVFSVLVGGARGACAASFAFTPLNTDGAVPATPEAINSSDQVVGITNDSKGDSVGFVWSSGNLTIVDGSLELSAINDSGIAVGAPWLNEPSYYVSYDISSGLLSEISPDLGLHGRVVFFPSGINEAGEVTGIAYARSGQTTGFITVDGKSSKLLPPHQKQSVPIALNTKGDIVIDYHGSDSAYNSYLFKKGKFSNIAVPGASTTTAALITTNDMIGGSFTSSGVTSGFLLSHGDYTTYSPAGATSSTVSGVGPSGQVYGTFVDAAGTTHGFVNVSGIYHQIDAPNSKFTEIFGAGKSGSIYGLYQSENGGAYGYIATCPKKDVCTQ